MVKGRRRADPCKQKASALSPNDSDKTSRATDRGLLSNGQMNKMTFLAKNSRRKDITDFFSPARSPTAADDADIHVPSSTGANKTSVMKSARLARTASTDTQIVSENGYYENHGLAYDCHENGDLTDKKIFNGVEANDFDEECIVIDIKKHDKMPNGDAFLGFNSTNQDMQTRKATLSQILMSDLPSKCSSSHTSGCCSSCCSSRSGSLYNGSDNVDPCDICLRHSAKTLFENGDALKTLVNKKRSCLAMDREEDQDWCRDDINDQMVNTTPSKNTRSSKRHSPGSNGDDPPVIDLTDECSHPKLSHSSPIVRQLFIPSPSNNDILESFTNKPGCERLLTPPPAPANSACSSTPSTPHKIQILEPQEDFLSPRTSSSLDKLNIQPEETSRKIRGRPKKENMAKSRKRLNIQAIDLTANIKSENALTNGHTLPDIKEEVLDAPPSRCTRNSPMKFKQEEDTKPDIYKGRPMRTKRNVNYNMEVESCKIDTKSKKVESTTNNNNNKKAKDLKNTQVTDFFPIRRSERKSKSTLLYERQMDIERKILACSHEGLRVEDFGAKGRGVVATRSFFKNEFVVEYVGELLDMKDAKIREAKYAMDTSKGCYMYYFMFNDVQYCIDGTEETSFFGRLVNHSRTNPNLVTKTVSVNDKPHLILVAKKEILAGTELLYDYGDRSKEALANHPWLAY